MFAGHPTSRPDQGLGAVARRRSACCPATSSAHRCSGTRSPSPTRVAAARRARRWGVALLRALATPPTRTRPERDRRPATCDYGGPVVAAVQQGNVYATQFHPEKSSERRAPTLLTNFVDLCREAAREPRPVPRDRSAQRQLRPPDAGRLRPRDRLRRRPGLPGPSLFAEAGAPVDPRRRPRRRSLRRPDQPARSSLRSPRRSTSRFRPGVACARSRRPTALFDAGVDPGRDRDRSGGEPCTGRTPSPPPVDASPSASTAATVKIATHGWETETDIERRRHGSALRGHRRRRGRGHRDRPRRHPRGPRCRRPAPGR